MFHIGVLLAGLVFLGFFIAQQITINNLKSDMSFQSMKWENFNGEYQEKYFPAGHASFRFDVTREAANSQVDLDIVEWAKSKKIPYDYDYTHHSDSDGDQTYGQLQLWFNKPADAMEYKLRWHNL